MRIAYLQFDGVSEAANAHRKVGNLFDVKLRAIENLHAAGIDVCLVVTIVNTVNNDQVGPIIKFALQNCDKISFVSFQPVSFTGRDEDISDDERHATPLHAVAPGRGREAADRRHRAAARLVSALGVERDVGRHRSAQGAGRRLGHAQMRLPSRLRHRHGASWSARRPRSGRRCRAFVNVERFLQDAARRSPTRRAGRCLTKVQTALSLLRNYSPTQAPEGFRLVDLLQKFDKQSGGQLGGKLGARDNGEPQAGRVAADVRRRHVVPGSLDLRLPAHRDVHHPYATQMGEISFCAYNTGVGWRQIVENMYQNATVADWYREHGKHRRLCEPAQARCRCRWGRIRSRSRSRATAGWSSGRRNRARRKNPREKRSCSAAERG